MKHSLFPMEFTFKLVMRFLHVVRAELKYTVKEDLYMTTNPFKFIHGHIISFLWRVKISISVMMFQWVLATLFLQRFSLMGTPLKPLKILDFFSRLPPGWW